MTAAATYDLATHRGALREAKAHQRLVEGAGDYRSSYEDTRAVCGEAAAHAFAGVLETRAVHSRSFGAPIRFSAELNTRARADAVVAAELVEAERLVRDIVVSARASRAPPGRLYAEIERLRTDAPSLLPALFEALESIIVPAGATTW